MIRQAISCDICGTEKKQTNHWFVAYDVGNELRLGGWNSRNKLRPGSKHLCGQTCLHKLVDEFMARLVAGRAPAPGDEQERILPVAAGADAALTSEAAFEESESSARLIPSPPPPRPIYNPPVELVPVSAPHRPVAEEIVEVPLPEPPPDFASRNRRAEAWRREREREMRATGRHPLATVRRRSG